MKLRRHSRLLLALAALVALGAVALMLYGRAFGGNTIQRLSSPDRSAIAEVSSTGAAGATDTDYLSVMLRTRLNPLRRGVFGGLDYGAKLRLSWLGNRDLLITCENCARLGSGQLSPKDMECRWRDVNIHYEFVGSSPVLHRSCP